MASESPRANPVLRPRFKGIENFLRKIAFNLGNTPSQTEVKIISCIPIDVTDLQNKIVDLERELDERDRDHDRERTPSTEEEPRRSSTVAHAAIGAPTFTPTAPLLPEEHLLNTPPPKSIHAVSPSPSLHAEPPSHISLSAIDSSPTRMPRSSTVITLDDRRETLANPTSIDGYNCTTKKRKLPKLKTNDKKKKGKTQMVYFAQTIYPKKVGEEETHRGKRRIVNEEEFSRTYLADMVQRQYRPKLINAEPSTSSGFSWPVCRDEPPGEAPRVRCDSDICSCCHGFFHNVDTPDDAESAHGIRRDCSVYYDSSLYDVVPVKETPSRILLESDVYQKRQNDVYQKRQNDVYLDMEGDYISNKANKPRVQFQQPYTTRYCTIAPPVRPNPKLRCKKKMPNKSALKKEQVIRAMQKKKQTHNSGLELNYSDCVDCGRVYTKPLIPKQRVILSTTPSSTQTPTQPPPSPVLQPVLKNAEYLSSSAIKENHTLVSRSVQLEPPPAPAQSSPPPPTAPPPPPHDNKTEITLNQIKSILHAVLTEVKTNAQKQVVPEDKLTKDAVVQNGMSQSNIATTSSYMNSYLFSPRYSFCPYGPSFSDQTTGSQGFYPPGSMVPPPCVFKPESKTLPRAPYAPPGPSPCAGAAKCIQNYPLFIHTQGRQCACCYRSVPTQPKLAATCPPPAEAPATVDVKKESRSKETNNLIKEIYKSLALNMDYAQKETSSNFTDIRSSINASNKKFEFKIEPKRKPKTVSSEILHKGDKPPLFVSKALREQFGRDQQFGSTAMSYRSEVKTGTTPSAAPTELATPRGDGVRSLLSAKKELLSTGSETAAETRERSPPAARDRKYSPSSARDRNYSPPVAYDREYSPPDRRDRQYSPADKRDCQYSPSDKRDRQYSPSDERDRGYSPSETRKRDRRHLPAENRRRDYPPQTPTTTVSDEDTITPSIDDSEESETTVIGTEKKEKKGIFSKMKKLFSARPRRRRKKDEDTSSDAGQEATSDSDDYETVYSERSSRSGKRGKRHRTPTPPPAPRRRRPHSKVSYSRYYRRDSPSPHAARRRHSPVASPARARRSPYMEQEYRRHWTEDLTFHQGNTPRYSSERPYTRSGREYSYVYGPPPGGYSSPRRPPPSPYWQEYEARRVQVPPPPGAPMPPLRPPMAPTQQPYSPPPQYQPAHGQVNSGGQTDSLKQSYLPQSYKPAAKGLAWFKKLNKPNFQCGVQWKNFLLEG